MHHLRMYGGLVEFMTSRHCNSWGECIKIVSSLGPHGRHTHCATDAGMGSVPAEPACALCVNVGLILGLQHPQQDEAACRIC